MEINDHSETTGEENDPSNKQRVIKENLALGVFIIIEGDDKNE